MMILPCLFVAHYIAMNVKLVISQQLGTRMALDTTEQIRRKLELCQNYLEVYDKVSRGYTKWRGRLMEQLSSAEIKMGIHQFQEVCVVVLYLVVLFFCFFDTSPPKRPESFYLN